MGMRNNNHIVLLRRCIISILIFTGLLLAYLALFYGNLLKNEEAVEITEWRYFTGKEEPALDDSDLKWTDTAESEAVSKPYGDHYVWLQHTISDTEESQFLYLRTGNHPLRIYIDGKLYHDTMGMNTLYTGNRVTKIQLPQSADSCALDIVLYSAAYLDVRAYLVPSNGTEAVWGPFAYMDIFLAVVLYLFAVFWVGHALFRRDRKGPLRRSLLLGAIALLAGISVLLNPAWTNIDAFSGAAFYRISLFVQMLLNSACCYLFIQELHIRNGATEFLLNGGLILAVFILLCPLVQLAVLGIKLYALWHIAMVVVLLYFCGRAEMKIYKNLWFVASFTLFLAQGGVWLTFLFEASHDYTGILPAAVLLYLSGMTVFYLKQQGKRVSREDEVLPKPSMPAASGILHYGEADVAEQASDYLTKLILEKCDGPNHHLLHVAEYVRAMCIKADLPPEEADFVARASLLHDIGKISLPPKILMKRTQLTQEEYEQIRCHVLYGDYLLNGDDPFLKLAAGLAKQHHEHYDGSGYLGLKGEEIHYYSRMIAIADVFDALTSDRPYKKAWSLEEGFAYIDSHKGSYFDPKLAALFESCHDEIVGIYEALARQTP